MEWISVEERLPDSDRDVLISDGVIVFEGWYDEKGNDWLIWIPCNKGLSFISAKALWPDRENAITHWSDDYSLPDNMPINQQGAF